jgi:hypothetical protein
MASHSDRAVDIEPNLLRRPTTLGTILSSYFILVILAVAVAALLQLRHADEPILESRRAGLAALFGGLVAASLVEIVKRATSFRGALQSRALRDHFGGTVVAAVQEPLHRTGAKARPTRLFASRDGFPSPTGSLYYSKPVEQLGAQLSELSERAVSVPQGNEELLAELAGRDVDDMREYAGTMSQWSASDDTSAAHGLAEKAAILRGEIEARIDAFQATTESQWRLALRLTACALSGIAAGLIGSGVNLSTAGIWTAVAAGLTIGTVAAWVTTDLIGIIHRFSDA